MSKITPLDFKNIRNTLFQKGLTHRELDELEQIATGSLFESGENRGMDRHEADQLVDTLRRHKSSHAFSDHQIDLISEAFAKHLR